MKYLTSQKTKIVGYINHRLSKEKIKHTNYKHVLFSTKTLSSITKLQLKITTIKIGYFVNEEAVSTFLNKHIDYKFI